MSTLYSGIYKAFILASAVSFLISFFTSGNNSYGSTLVGYCTLILGIILILLLLFNNIFRVTQNDNSSQVFYLIFTTAGPFLLMLAVISMLVYLIVNYKNIIVENNVSASYNTFTNVVIILFILQSGMVFYNINSERFETTGKLSPIVSSLLYLLGVLTIFCTWIIYISLKYYTTDGFQ
jgi:hypothetical protein